MTGGVVHILVKSLVFWIFLVIFNGFAMVLAGVFGFFDFIGFSYGLTSEAAIHVCMYHCSRISCAYNINIMSYDNMKVCIYYAHLCRCIDVHASLHVLPLIKACQHVHICCSSLITHAVLFLFK